MKILSIRIIHQTDDNPDLSYLGEYSNNPASVHIDRKERGDMGRFEMRYFNAGCGDPDYIEQDYARAEAYNRGEWGMIGISAVADVQFSNGAPTQKIRSGGLWGIESDSDTDYFSEVEREELDALRSELLSVGFSKRAVTSAMKNVERP